MIEVCDLVRHDNQVWRVSNHLKRCEYSPLCPVDDDTTEGVANQIVNEIVEEEIEGQRLERQAKGLPHSNRYYLNYCRPEEATHVSVVGVCGGIFEIGECEKVGVVDWSEERIEEEKQSALKRIGRSHFAVIRWE